MATVLIPTLKDPKYMNWIRAGLGLLITKKSISPATMRIIEDFHRSIGGVPTPLPGAISAVTPPAAAAVTALGCSCTFKDIDFRKKCMKTHSTICNPLVQLILAAHKFPTIFKDNCDPCKWSTDPWEMAKAFMGPGQQEDSHGPEQTDCANLVLLWDNCSHFSSHISDKTLMKKVREARNAGMHSPKMTLSDTEMKSAFESMINLLQDATLSAEPDIDASNGISELEKVRDQGMSILPEDELNVWLDQIQSLDNSWEQLKRRNEPVAAFLQKNPGLLEKISQELPKLQGRVAGVEVGLHQVKLKVDVLQEDVAGMKMKMEKSPARKDSMALLQELRRDLAESYLTGECSRTQPISSLCKTLPVKELLVPVSLTRTKRDSFRQGEEDERSIDAEAILSPMRGDSSSPKRILVEGEPGRGKSMLSKSLALSWAQDVRSPPPEPATRQDKASQSLLDSGTGTPAQPKKEVSVTPINAFLIVVLFTVNTLIGGGVAENLLLLVAANWKSREEEISECLNAHSKQVLLIFDGFDEASSPQPEILTKILDGRWMRGCTIITTSRPGFCGSAFDVSYRLEGFDMKKRESYAAAQSRGVIVPVELWVGWFDSDPGWTEAECRSLAQLKQIRTIVIWVRGWSGLEALSRGLTADTQLQDLTVYCEPGDDDGGDHSLPEFRSNVQRLSNIEEIVLSDSSGRRVSDAAATQRTTKQPVATLMLRRAADTVNFQKTSGNLEKFDLVTREFGLDMKNLDLFVMGLCSCTTATLHLCKMTERTTQQEIPGQKVALTNLKGCVQ